LRGALWQCAYEHHYRDALINALANNHGRWAGRERRRPQAQIVFCIDDREEFSPPSGRAEPADRNLGAAGFFGVVMNWRGLDDREVTPLCPVVVTPAHEVREVGATGNRSRAGAARTAARSARSAARVLPRIRRNLLSSALLIDALAPGALLTVLVGKLFLPGRQANFVAAVGARWVPDVPTQVAITAAARQRPATPEQPRLGFTDAEQADRVAALLRNIGLTAQFAPLVVLMGHGSISQNNPHLAAYDCGACSGRHGGPNARDFAAMANRPEVRALLAERGIRFPDDAWFLGAEHNTCDEQISFLRSGRPAHALEPALRELQRDSGSACALSAHERCRRFASAPRHPVRRTQALRHVVERSKDFSQARPELGHATNAAALVGRRSMSQGVFLDRRAFLISYDPTQDPTARCWRTSCWRWGRSGAGINLEYYFSTVNNERLGCGTKTSAQRHRLFAVMEGASSDLRTGLPRQMIEIHEPLRLQIVVEARTEVLAAIYGRQADLARVDRQRVDYTDRQGSG
jgi:uncharacterized protein YbcC (UPF0753/DUF2309 family)